MVDGAVVIIDEAHCPEERGDDAFGGAVWKTLLSADRTSTAALTAGVAVLPAQGREVAREHRHPVPEMYYVLTGRGVLSAGGVDHELRAGTAVFLPPDVWHVARNTGTEELRILYAFPTDSFADVTYTFRRDDDAPIV